MVSWCDSKHNSPLSCFLQHVSFCDCKQNSFLSSMFCSICHAVTQNLMQLYPNCFQRYEQAGAESCRLAGWKASSQAALWSQQRETETADASSQHTVNATKVLYTRVPLALVSSHHLDGQKETFSIVVHGYQWHPSVQMHTVWDQNSQSAQWHFYLGMKLISCKLVASNTQSGTKIASQPSDIFILEWN